MVLPLPDRAVDDASLSAQLGEGDRTIRSLEESLRRARSETQQLERVLIEAQRGAHVPQRKEPPAHLPQRRMPPAHLPHLHAPQPGHRPPVSDETLGSLFRPRPRDAAMLGLVQHRASAGAEACAAPRITGRPSLISASVLMGL